MFDIEEDDDGGTDRKLEPPSWWRRFKQPTGVDYFFDPRTDIVHYLTETGKGNFAVDTARGGSYYYDDLEDLSANCALPHSVAQQAQGQRARVGRTTN